MVPATAAPRRGPITEEERRRNRMTSNRLSARKTRMKKQQHVNDLAAAARRLERENEALRVGAGAARERCRLLEQENRVLMAHARELCSVLQLRTFQLRLLGGVAGVPLDVPDVGDHLVQLYGGLPPTPTPPPPPPAPVQMLPQRDEYDEVLGAILGMLEF